MEKSLFLKDSNNIIENDSFGIHTQIANTINEIIKSSNLKDCSFNLGLFGSWGSGKSFIVKHLEKNDFCIFNIDVWKFVGNPLMRIDLSNLGIFINVLKNNTININKTNFRDYIISTYYDNTNLNKSMKLFDLLLKNEYKILEKDVLKIKNKLIDFYKENPVKGLEYLNLIKNAISEKTFNKEFLYTLFSNMKSRLEEANPITSYCNLNHFITESFTSEYSALLKELIDKILEDNQELAEYEFGLRLIQALKDFSTLDVTIFVDKLKVLDKTFNDNLKQQVLSIYPDFNKIDEEINKG